VGNISSLGTELTSALRRGRTYQHCKTPNIRQLLTTALTTAIAFPQASISRLPIISILVLSPNNGTPPTRPPPSNRPPRPLPLHHAPPSTIHKPTPPATNLQLPLRQPKHPPQHPSRLRPRSRHGPRRTRRSRQLQNQRAHYRHEDGHGCCEE
jgi:hypothetical protein